MKHAISAAVCPKEHPYDKGNTYYDHKGWRYCRTCNRQRAARRRNSSRFKTALISVVLPILVGLSSAQASAFTAQLCWYPLDAAANPNLAGFNIHVDDQTLPYEAVIIDAGLPTPNASGMLVHTVPVDGPTTTTRFRVAAYFTDGLEGPLSPSMDITCTTAETVTGRPVCVETCLKGDYNCNGDDDITDVLIHLRDVNGIPVPECSP